MYSAAKMEQKIDRVLRYKEPHEVTSLNLNHIVTSRVLGLTSDFKNLVCLTLNGCQLITLEGLPLLPNLKKLSLSNNKLRGGLEMLMNCPTLRNLDICNNRLSIAALTPLKDLKHLIIFDLFLNDFGGDYTEKVFEMIPSLLWMDGFSREGTEIVPSFENAYEKECLI